MHPEENLANLWIQRLHLTPPVDVQSVLKGFADVSEDDLPVEADALLIRRAGKRPAVILQQGQSAGRASFTMAHELGHILIPWHTGSFVCKADPSMMGDGVSVYEYLELEREANRFAAEFLVPADYVQSLFLKFGHPVPMLAEVTKQAKVSKLAASFKFLTILPPGFIMTEVDSWGVVRRSGRTEDTTLSQPKPGMDWNADIYTAMGAVVNSTTTSLGELYWIDCRKALMPRPAVPHEITSRMLIDQIFKDRGLEDEKPSMLASINGIIGSANGPRVRAGADLYTILCDTFQNREAIAAVVTHPKFRDFLAARVREIEARKR